MSHTIYVVRAEEGQYSDHSKWNCAAYTNRRQADLHVERATAWCAAFKLSDADEPRVSPFDVEESRAYSADMREYSVDELTVRDSVPEDVFG